MFNSTLMQDSILGKKGYKKLKGITDYYNNRWFNHYQLYLMEMAYQLFEWKNLPSTIDPRFLEQQLHNLGYVCFYRDKIIGDVVLTGAISGQLNHYNLPHEFNPSSVNYIRRKPIKLLNYDEIDENDKDKGILIMNNDMMRNSIDSLQLFAIDLAEIKSVIRVNMNAQKTPVLIKSTEQTQLSMKNAYSQYEGNAPVLVVDEAFNEDGITVFKTDAPYVVDKLNTQKNAVWNELMTFLGVDNANLEKRERMITSEADSNNEQIEASGNRMLKSRQDACKKINALYGLNISVGFRQSVVDKLRSEVQSNGELYNASERNNQPLQSISNEFNQ